MPAGSAIPVVMLLPGDCQVSRGEKAFSTLLGSCVTACIYDWVKGIGGMNHFMLPEHGSLDPTRAVSDKSARYGDYAMELLINRSMALGADRKHLVAKLFGGAAMLNGIGSQIGIRNAEFALNYLSLEKIQVVAVDLGGDCARKLCFWPKSGQVELRRIHTSARLINRELDYARKVQEEDPAGPIVFF